MKPHQFAFVAPNLAALKKHQRLSTMSNTQQDLVLGGRHARVPYCDA
jgi:hypothetical protein